MASSSITLSYMYPKKRKRVVLTLENTLTILDHLKAASMQEKLADEYGIGCSTVHDTKKNEDKVRSFTSIMENLAMSKKG